MKFMKKYDFIEEYEFEDFEEWLSNNKITNLNMNTQESNFVKDVPDKYILKTDNNVKFCFIDVKVGKEIGIFNEDK